MNPYVVRINIEVDDSIEGEALEIAAIETLRAVRALPGELAIVLTTDETIQELNQRYRDIDKTTDVLSFIDGGHDPDSGALYYGDVLISYALARAQAGSAGHPVQDELALLTIHGVLHLTGMDHDSNEARKKMFAVQAEVLNKLDTRIGSERLEAK